jgi:hypothetical protein
MDTEAPKDPPAPVPPAAAVEKPRTGFPFWPLVIAFVAVGAGSLLVFAWMPRPTTASVAAADVPVAPTSVAKSESPSRPSEAPPSDAPKKAAAPKWFARPSRYDSRDGRDIVTFELAANEDVVVAHSRVRPHLGIRCAGRTSEVYVTTHSAASPEGSTAQHTVELSFDDREVVVQKWEHSVDHNALFASDSKALVSQIVGASAMAFTFTPFSEPPVQLRFNVDGFSKHLATAARTCGWPEARPAKRRV